MGILNDKPGVAVMLIVILLSAAVLTIWRSVAGAGAGVVEAVYRYNLNTGELVAVPIDAPPSPDTVAARVYACGECSGDNMQVLVLEKKTEQARRLMEQQQQTLDPDADNTNPADTAHVQQTITGGTLVAVPPEAGEEPQWVPIGSPEAMPLETKFLTLCNGERAKNCSP